MTAPVQLEALAMAVRGTDGEPIARLEVGSAGSAAPRQGLSLVHFLALPTPLGRRGRRTHFLSLRGAQTRIPGEAASGRAGSRAGCRRGRARHRPGVTPARGGGGSGSAEVPGSQRSRPGRYDRGLGLPSPPPPPRRPPRTRTRAPAAWRQRGPPRPSGPFTHTLRGGRSSGPLPSPRAQCTPIPQRRTPTNRGPLWTHTPSSLVVTRTPAYTRTSPPHFPASWVSGELIQKYTLHGGLWGRGHAPPNCCAHSLSPHVSHVPGTHLPVPGQTPRGDAHSCSPRACLLPPTPPLGTMSGARPQPRGCPPLPCPVGK